MLFMKTGSHFSLLGLVQAVVRLARWLVLGLLLVNVVVFLALAGLRLWSPDLAPFKDRIEAELSAASGYGIRIGEVEAAWQGLRPGILLRAIEINLPEGQHPDLKLPKVRAILAPSSLLFGQPALRELTVTDAELPLRRHADDSWQLAGFPRFFMHGGDLSGLNILVKYVHDIRLRKTRVMWRDDRAKDTLELRNVELGVYRRLGGVTLSADAGEAIEACQHCFVSLESKGAMGQVSRLGGVIRLDISGLQVERLPGVLRERLLPSLQGMVTAQLRSQWRDGRPVDARGLLAVSRLRAQVPDMKPPLQLETMRAHLEWQAEPGQVWQLDLDSPLVSAGGKQWRERTIFVRYGAQGGAIQLSRLNLDKLLAVARQVLPGQEQLVRLANMKPAGILRKVDFQWRGPLWHPEHYTLDGILQGVGIDATGKIPGLRGLTGRLQATESEGSLELDARELEIQLPRVFRQPLLAEQTRGTVSWKRQETGSMELRARDFRMRADGVQARLNARFSLDRNSPADSRLDLRVDFRGGDGTQAAKYYPVNVTPAPLLAWMDAAIKDGDVISGHGIFKGRLRDFPFVNNNGQFEVLAHLRRGRLSYLPGWPALEEADAVLFFRNAGMLLTARQGRIGGLEAREVVVSAENFLDPTGRRIHIRGTLEGPVNTTLASIKSIAKAQVASDWARLVPGGVRASGQGTMRLDFSFDPGAPQREFRLDGKYETAGSQWGWGAPNWMRVRQGVVQFDQKGVYKAGGDGQLFGGKAIVSAGRTDQALQISASGEMYASTLAQSVLPAWSRHAQGALPWRLQAQWDDQGPLFEGEVNLDALSLDLPRPLKKTADVPASLTLKSTREQGQLQLQLSALPLGKAQLRLARNQDGYYLDQGVLAAGTAPANLVDKGLWLSVAAPEVNLDHWQDTMSTRLREPPTAIAGVVGRFGNVRFLGRDLGDMQLRFRKVERGWSGHMEGGQVAGSLQYTFGRPVDRIQARLQVLRAMAPVAETPSWDARTLPNADIQVQDFQYGDLRLGRIQLVAQHQPRGWVVRKFLSRDPGLALSATGEITQSGTRKSAHLQLTGESDDTGAAMEALGSPGVVKGGTLRLNANLNWKDVTELDLFNVNGEINLSAKSGEFLKLDEGSARVLGFLNLRALSRYLRLDFRTLFSKGYNYDSIKGAMRIEQSDLYTHNLAVKGPSADLRISGRVGLKQRDYDLVVGANPSVGDTLAIASWGLGAPQVGAAILLFNRIFKGNLEKSTQLTYLVRGSWDDPKVERIGVGPLQQKEGAGLTDGAGAQSE